MVSSFGLPQTDSFDTQVHLTLTRKQTTRAKACSGLYKFLPTNSTFDYLDQNDFYPITLRVVRFPLTTDSYECVITNLPRDTFPPDELKKLYGLRWGIESSFRELKYAIGLSCFHAKKGGVYQAGNLCPSASLQLLRNHHDPCGDSAKRYKARIPSELHAGNPLMSAFSAIPCGYISTRC